MQISPNVRQTQNFKEVRITKQAILFSVNTIALGLFRGVYSMRDVLGLVGPSPSFIHDPKQSARVSMIIYLIQLTLTYSVIYVDPVVVILSSSEMRKEILRIVSSQFC